MQPKAQVRLPFGLFIVESKAYFDITSKQRVVYLKRNFSRILARLYQACRQRVSQKSSLADRALRVREDFVPEETMIPSHDLFSLIQRLFIPETMQKITHHRRVILPSAPGRNNFFIAVQVRHGISITPPTRYADQFGSQIVDDNSESAFAIDNLIQLMPLLFESSMLKGHIRTCGTIRPRGQALMGSPPG